MKNRKNKLKVAALLCSSLIVFSLAACGSENGESSVPVNAFTSSYGKSNSSTSTPITNSSKESYSSEISTVESEVNNSSVSNEKLKTEYAKHIVSLKNVMELVKLNGRTSTNGDGVILEWSASGFTMSGKLEGEVSAVIDLASKDMNCYIRVDVDSSTSVIKIKDGKKKYTLAVELKKGNHTITVSKMTECFMNSLIVSEIEFTGTLNEVKPAKHQIEFIGDSITAGYDIYIEGAPDGDVSEYEDATRTYAAYTAKAFGADYNVLACAGWGVMGGGMGDWQNMPGLYENSTFKLGNGQWSFSQYQPAVVVIALGENDSGYMWKFKKTDVEFEKAAVNFLKKIRKNNPDAHIIWCGKKVMENLIQNAVDEFKKTDKKVSFVHFDNTSRVAGSHPSENEHVVMSKALQKEITKVTGWRTIR